MYVQYHACYFEYIRRHSHVKKITDHLKRCKRAYIYEMKEEKNEEIKKTQK